MRKEYRLLIANIIEFRKKSSVSKGNKAFYSAKIIEELRSSIKLEVEDVKITEVWDPRAMDGVVA